MKKLFSNPVKATFGLSFLITSAISYYYHYTITARHGGTFWNLFKWSLTSTFIARDTFFAPLFVASLTALLVLAWRKTKVALADQRLIRYSSRAGFVLLYPVLAIFGVSGIMVAF